MLSDDSELIVSIAAGNQDALHQLYVRYRDRLWRYLYHLLAEDPSWVDEVVQDVFLSVWTNAHAFRQEATASTWMFRIAHNKALHARRAHFRRPEGHVIALPGEDDERDPIWETPSPEDVVLDRLALGEAFHQLSPKHREVLELYFYQGFSFTEIAQILDVPGGTVRSRLSYARHALLKRLTPTQKGEGIIQ